MSGINVQIAKNLHDVNLALARALSGLDCGKYLIINQTLPYLAKTNSNTVTTTQANTVWTTLCSRVQSAVIGGKVVPNATCFTDAFGSGDQIVTPSIAFENDGGAFTVRFYRYDSDPFTIKLQGIGTASNVTKTVGIDMTVTKNSTVLNYAVASKCRMWITGDSTIHGNVYSSWKYQNIPPFNMTSDSKVLGTINTILTNIDSSTDKAGTDLYDGTTKMPYHLETLDASGKPEYDSSENKVISLSDEIQGQCQGINYGVDYGDKAVNMPGMQISDYDTSQYKAQTTVILPSYYNPHAVTEYFPHAVNDYTRPGPSGGLRLTRYVCENRTLTNARVTPNKNALFKNCTFNDILYIDNSTGSNAVRFENCIFNGPIVTTPSTDTSSGWWQKNQLYFTGEETFQNHTDVPAAILAPNFNVNLGNTNPNTGEDNVLTGAIIGGIVDVRGNAQIYGTIISMFDTGAYSSGYVSNIGATLGDGGSETSNARDVGVISITPAPDKMLPNGITTPIVIKPLQDTYSEVF